MKFSLMGDINDTLNAYQEGKLELSIKLDSYIYVYVPIQDVKLEDLVEFLNVLSNFKYAIDFYPDQARFAIDMMKEEIKKREPNEI